jgi:hypothetical protein
LASEHVRADSSTCLIKTCSCLMLNHPLATFSVPLSSCQNSSNILIILIVHMFLTYVTHYNLISYLLIYIRTNLWLNLMDIFRCMSTFCNI